MNNKNIHTSPDPRVLRCFTIQLKKNHHINNNHCLIEKQDLLKY